MKYKLLRYHTRTYLKRNRTIRQNLSFKKAATIGLIFTTEDRQKHDQIKDIIRKFEQEGKKVKVIAYLPPNQENYEFMFDIFTAREISFWGNITASNALDFADTAFDFLLYLDNTPNDFILNLIARSKAKCRIGKYWEDAQPYFELMIGSNSTTRALISEIFRYTTALR